MVHKLTKKVKVLSDSSKKKKEKKLVAKKRKVLQKEKTDGNGLVVSAKIVKTKKKVSLSDPMVKALGAFFDDHLKKEFSEFLTKRNAAVVPISSAKSAKKGKGKKRGKYKQEGAEPVSFEELTSFRNPLFSMGGTYSPEEYNPDTIDVATYNIMRRDSQLAAGLAIIKLPITSLPWRVECDDIKIARTCEWALKKVYRDLVKSSLLAVDYGFACHEKVWERGNVKISNIDKEGKENIHHNGDLVYWRKIKPNHPESIMMKFDTKQNLMEIWQESDTQGRIKLPVRKVFLFTNEKEYGNPFGTSRLKNAYKVWYWKELLYQFMMQYYERRGTPPAIATAPPGKSQDSSGVEVNNMELALRMAGSLISSSVAALPYQANKGDRENMWKLEFLKDDARGPMFIDAMSHLDSRCLRAIYVPDNVVTQEGGGGYSSASIHADLFLMSEKGLVTDFEDAVDMQLLTPFVEANYPPDKRRPAHLKLDPLDWNRKIALKEIFVELLRNLDTMMQLGIAPEIIPSIEAMADILEIPVETWKDATGMDGIPDQNSVAPGGNPPEDSKNKGKKKKTPLIKKRGKSTPQDSDKRRINPGGRRSERTKVRDSSKKPIS